MKHIAILLTGTACLTACAPTNTAAPGNAAEPPVGTNVAVATNVSSLPPVDPPEPGTPGGLPDDRTPLAEGPIDAKSPQGAAQVVQLAAAFGEERQLAKVLPLLSPALRDKVGGLAGLEKRRASFGELHAQTGGPSAAEGAAGSSYVTVPVVLYGRTADTKAFSRRGEVTLRRVNDIPGASAEQLTWHIDAVTFEKPITR